MTQLSVFPSVDDAATLWTSPPCQTVSDPNEIVVDCFAGGGGASEGIRRALGRSPHIAINHKPEMIALHAANHADSEHYPASVWKVDPVEVCRGRPVGLLWLSPDCTHFSKAKGRKPVKKTIRALAWVAIRWVAAVRPRVIIIENVEEFEGWGPVARGTEKPCPKRKGQTFKAFVRKLRRQGYHVEWRRLRACDFGAPTTRQRLFLVARCDGEPIVWPQATHGPGKLHPWRTAAECIDWSIACPSIFLTKQEAKALGYNVKRPLVANTLRRIARGVYRFVINNPRPFIVPVTHSGDARSHSIGEPLRTVTGSPRGDFALVQPFLANYHAPKRDGDDRLRSVDELLPTLDTSNRFGLVMPFVAGVGGRMGQSPERGVDRPYQTITAKGDAAVVSPFMVPRYGERDGQEPRSSAADQPLPTIVPTQNGAQLVSAFLAKHFGGHETPGSAPELPFDTVTSRDHHAVVAAHISKFYGDRVGSPADAPLDTVMATSAKHAVVTAHLQRDFGKSIGSDVAAPTPTITGGGGGHAALVASSLVKLKGTAKDGQPLDEPVHTIQAGGNHYAEVRAFLSAYYGTEKNGQGLFEPMRTVTADDRFALVTVHGVEYVIVDIGMRMLQPRELFRAQGFHDSYVIDIEFAGKPISKEIQTEMVGNSVSPPNAEALVLENFRPSWARRGSRSWDVIDAIVERRIKIERVFDFYPERLDELRAEIADEDLGPAVDAWDRELSVRQRAGDLAPATVAHYRRQVNWLFPKDEDGARKPVRRSTLTSAFLKAKLGAVAGSSTNKRRHAAGWNSLLSYLVEAGKLERNPLDSVTLPANNKTNRPRIDRLEDVIRFVNTFPEGPHRAAAAFQEGAGVEMQAMLNTYRRDIVDEAHRVIWAHGGKNDHRDRQVIVDEWAFTIIMAYVRKHPMHPDAKLFGEITEDTHRARWYEVRDALRSKGVNIPANYKPHSCRNTFAVRGLKDGRDPVLLSSNLGHADTSELLRLYGKHRPAITDLVRADQRGKEVAK